MDDCEDILAYQIFKNLSHQTCLQAIWPFFLLRFVDPPFVGVHCRRWGSLGFRYIAQVGELSKQIGWVWGELNPHSSDEQMPTYHLSTWFLVGFNSSYLTGRIQSGQVRPSSIPTLKTPWSPMVPLCCLSYLVLWGIWGSEWNMGSCRENLQECGSRMYIRERCGHHPREGTQTSSVIIALHAPVVIQKRLWIVIAQLLPTYQHHRMYIAATNIFLFHSHYSRAILRTEIGVTYHM